MTTEPAVEAIGLTKTYPGGVQAVRGLDFAVEPGEVFGLLGANGALRDRAGTTIVLTTHYLDEAERLCDRVAIVHLGEIVALDSPRALLRGLGEQILEFQTHEEPHAVLAALRREHVAGDDAFVIGARVTVPLHGRSAADALAAIERAAVHARDVTTRVPTLDDVYLQRTGADLAEAA